MPVPDPAAVSANAYAIAYRLLGDRSAAHAAVGIAISRLQATGAFEHPDWLARLAGAVVAESVGSAAAGVSPADADPTGEGLRVALRRRLASASDEERVAAALHHLAGYPIDQVAGFMGRTPQEADRLAAALAPPPGISYRKLGDPELIGAGPSRPTRPLIPLRLSTVLSAVAVLALVFGASRCVGPRPRLGPAPERAPVVVSRDVASRGSVGCSLPPQAAGVYASTAEPTGAAEAGGAVPFRLAVPVPAAPTPPSGGGQAGSGTEPDPTAIGAPAAVPRPLLVAVADADSTADSFATSSGLESAGLEAGDLVVTVAPVAHGTVAAVDAVAAVLDTASRQLCVDRNRVTVAGLGTGGQTATAVACRRPAEVAVVVAVGGASMSQSCELSPAVSLLMRWAADDQVLPPAGGYGTQAVPPSPDAAPLPPSPAGQVTRHWARAIGAGEPTRSISPDGAAVEEARTAAGSTVRWVTTPAGGHAWTADDTAETLTFAASHARSTG